MDPQRLADFTIERAADGVFWLDADGRFRRVNEAAGRLFGYTRDELLSLTVHDLIPGGEADRWRDHWARLQQSKVLSYETTLRAKDGRLVSVEISSNHIEFDGVAYSCCFARDITERKQLESRLREEERLAAVARALADVGHDLKNLLTPVALGARLVIGDLDECERALPALDPEKARVTLQESREVMQMIRDAARRIEGRVREIADTVKGVSAPPQFGSCSVESVVRSVFEALTLYAKEGAVALHAEGLESLPLIHADESRLFNALYNLVNNAIPETPRDGSVTVRGGVDGDGRHVIISVVDTGRGMPAEVRDSLFTYKATSRKRGGTGLGTKIVKDVVDAHGGTITVDSQEGVGTTFRIRLPVEQPVR